MRPLVIASGNAGKIREFEGLLAALPLAVRPQPQGLEVEETGTTFAANARIKACAVAAATGEWALADDSGLSVDALSGEPGVIQPAMRQRTLSASKSCLTPCRVKPIEALVFAPPCALQRPMNVCFSRWKAAVPA